MPKVTIYQSKNFEYNLQVVVAEYPDSVDVFIAPTWDDVLEVAKDWVRTTKDGKFCKVQIAEFNKL